MLAFFLAVLLGVPLPAASLANASPAGVKQLQPGKATTATRLTRRDLEDPADPADPEPLLLGVAPRIETALQSRRPAGSAGVAPGHAPSEPRHNANRARAPPAA